MFSKWLMILALTTTIINISCKKNSTGPDTVLFNTCIIELVATGHYTATPEDPSPPYDYNRSFNGELFMVSGNFSGNTFTGTTEIIESGGSLHETITAILSDDQETIVNISGAWSSLSAGSSNEHKSIIATNIPILPGSDSDLFEFQIDGPETCDHISSIEDHAQSSNFGPNYTLNSLECDSGSKITVTFRTE